MKISMKTLKEYGIITLGVILLAVSLEYFYYPNDIVCWWSIRFSSSY